VLSFVCCELINFSREKFIYDQIPKVPDSIQELLPEAVVYLQSHLEIVFAYLSGSLAKGKPAPLRFPRNIRPKP
jgi:hypothetical protein